MALQMIEMDLQFQNIIEGPPLSAEQLWSRCTGNDKITVTSWGNTWANQTEVNRKSYDFNALTAMALHGKEAYKPIILAGSGPSLKKNVDWLLAKKVKNQFGEEMDWPGRGGIRIVSCVHNFPMFEDRGVMTKDDYYVNLDAGPITITEMHEGGKFADNPQHYWDLTKDRTLVAHHCTHPDFLKKWQGPKYFFSDQSFTPGSLDPWLDVTIVPPLQVGGCVLGAAMYFSEIILGASQVVFIGADFSFSYNKKFHAWDSQYDQKFSGVIPATDIFGNRVWTWPSYENFAFWFQYHACGGGGNNSHNWVNCTEGGILGSWPHGNIKQIPQMVLSDYLKMQTRHSLMPYWQKKKVLLW